MISAEKPWPCKHIRTLHCKLDPIYLFPEMSLPRLVHDFHIHVSVSNFYIPRIGLPLLLQQNWWTDPGKMWITQIFECRNWEWGCTVSFLGIIVSNFRGAVSLQRALIRSLIHATALRWILPFSSNFCLNSAKSVLYPSNNARDFANTSTPPLHR